MGELVKFVAAPVISKFFISLLCTLDDGLFISRYCGQYALAAFSIVMPWFMFIDAVGMLVSAVGTRCSMLLGEKKNEAYSSFTTMTFVSFGVGCILALILTCFRKQLLIVLGATDILMPYAMSYLDVYRFYVPLLILSYIFQRFYVIAGKPQMAVASTIISTILNFGFDWLFICHYRMGLVGTAYANLISNFVVTIMGVVFFLNKKEEIYFGKPLAKTMPLIKQVWKLGRSQALTSLALSANSYLSNTILLKLGGELIIAGSTIVSNVTFMFMNAFFGMLGATMPIVSYAYGEKSKEKLVRILKQIALLVVGLSALIIAIFILFKEIIIDLYLINSDDASLRNMVEYGLKVAPYVFIFFGLNVMVQEDANSVGNYKISTFLSIMENVVFSNVCTVVMPLLFGVNATWYVFLVTEVLTMFFSLYIIYANKDAYGYGKSGLASELEK